MSHVILLAADRALPLHDAPGLSVAEHRYYRDSVDLLGFPMKPFPYELDVRSGPEPLIDYLRQNLSPGDTAELWSVWVGTGGGEHPRRYRGRLEEFDRETLEMLTKVQYEPDLTGEYAGGLISQVCLTVEI